MSIKPSCVAQYMIRHDERRLAMIARAREWTDMHSSARRFWQAALGQLRILDQRRERTHA